MLTAAERPRCTASRIKGRPALVRSLRGLLLRVHRFGRGRARTPQDMQWAARVLDSLYAALATAEGTTNGGEDLSLRARHPRSAACAD